MGKCVVVYINNDIQISKNFDIKLTLTVAASKNIITGKQSSVVALATSEIAF